MNLDPTHDALSVLFDVALSKGCRCIGVKEAFLSYCSQAHSAPLLFVLQALSLSLPPTVDKATLDSLAQALTPKKEALEVTGVMTRVRVDESLPAVAEAHQDVNSPFAGHSFPEATAEIDFMLDHPSQLDSLRTIFMNHRAKISVA